MREGATLVSRATRAIAPGEAALLDGALPAMENMDAHGKGHRPQAAGGSTKSPCHFCADESAVGRPHAHWPTGLCELDRVGQAAADAKAAGRECPLTACVGKAAALLLCDGADESLHRSEASFKSAGAVETAFA